MRRSCTGPGRCRSPKVPWRTEAALGTGSISIAASRPSSGRHAAQSSGDERPVPRWSTSTMSRSLRTSTSSAASGPSRVAACPGPPARMNSGSGRGESVLAGSTATASLIVRPCGSARFSGTSSSPHCAATASRGRRHSASAMARAGALPRSPQPATMAASAATATTAAPPAIRAMACMAKTR